MRPLRLRIACRTGRERPRALGLDRLNPSQFDLVWFRSALEESRELLGGDLCPYGVEASRSTLEALTQYSYEQGFVSRKYRPEEFFAPNTLHEFAE